MTPTEGHTLIKVIEKETAIVTTSTQHEYVIEKSASKHLMGKNAVLGNDVIPVKHGEYLIVKDSDIVAVY